MSPMFKDGERCKKADNEIRAVSRMLRVSPQKLNLLATLIRGKGVSRAINELAFSRKRIAVAVKKTVASAVANAEYVYAFDARDLVVSEAYVGKAIVMKRFRARARGRSSKIRKSFSNFTVVLRKLETV